MEVDEDDDFLKLNSSSSPFPPFWVVTDDCRAKFVRYKGCERGEGRGEGAGTIVSPSLLRKVIGRLSLSI